MSVEAMALPKPQSFEHKADVFDDGCAHDFNVDAMVFPALPDLPPFPESHWSDCQRASKSTPVGTIRFSMQQNCLNLISESRKICLKGAPVK